MAKRNLRVGYSFYPPYFEQCAFETPITCEYPGASLEGTRLLEKYYDANFEFVNFKGYGFGAPSEEDTIFRGLLNGSVETAGATMWYITERVTNLPLYSFPLISEQLVAVVNSSSPLINYGTRDPLDIERQGAVWALFFVLGIFTYFAYHYFEFSKKNSLRVSKHLLDMNTFFFSLLILLYMNFLGSTIAILLFKSPPKILPFSNFDDLADALLEGKIRLVSMDSAPGRFTSPGEEFAKSDPTLTKFYQANQIPERVVLVKFVNDAFKIVDEEDRVYVINLMTAKRYPKICDYEIISDSSFPTIPMGFFFSNVSAAPWFRPDVSLMQSTGYMFQHFLKNYEYPHDCVKEKPRKAFGIKQTASMFYILLAGFAIGFVALWWEMIHKTIPKRFHLENVKKDEKYFSGPPTGSSAQIIRRLKFEYEAKTVVNGICNQGGDLWVCFKRKIPKCFDKEIQGLEKFAEFQKFD